MYQMPIAPSRACTLQVHQRRQHHNNDHFHQIDKGDSGESGSFFEAKYSFDMSQNYESNSAAQYFLFLTSLHFTSIQF
jgi:hypothetical protein